jgi:hypothetical protein
MQTNISRRRLLCTAVCVVLLQACGGPKSSSTSGPTGGPMPTSQMTMNLTVESKEAGSAVVRANLNDGHTFGKSYRLDGGDFLEACVNGVCHSMADNDSVFTPDYIARFGYQPGVDYVVSFNRRGAQSALDSRVALPPVFTVLTPVNHQPVTDGDTVVVSWAPSGAPAHLTVKYHADCTHTVGTSNSFSLGSQTDSDGDGQEAFEIDEIVDFSGLPPSSPITKCSIDFIVQDELRGRIDPAFGDGTAVGIVSRQVTVDYVPH